MARARTQTCFDISADGQINGYVHTTRENPCSRRYIRYPVGKSSAHFAVNYAEFSTGDHVNPPIQGHIVTVVVRD